MLFCLHRRDVERAELAESRARETHLATAASFGAEGGQRALNDFFAAQMEIAVHDPFKVIDPSQPTAGEIAFFRKQEARARAAAQGAAG